MKKKACILLIITLTIALFYNVIGYYLIYAFEKEQSWVATMQEIPDSDFKVIKLNATLYSFIDDTELEYVNENFTLKNKTYHIFKKQIKDNVLSLYYLPNQQSNSYASLNKLVQGDFLENAPLSKNPLEKLIKTFSKDYLSQNNNYFKTSFDANTLRLKTDLHPNGILQSGYLPQLFSPPKREFI